MAHCSFCEMSEEQAIREERERIVALLEAWAADDDADFDDTLALIKGENK
jgi:hypothetical protein